MWYADFGETESLLSSYHSNNNIKNPLPLLVHSHRHDVLSNSTPQASSMV
jgi:hypothetical protein